jgi:hypothetical protein
MSIMRRTTGINGAPAVDVARGGHGEDDGHGSPQKRRNGRDVQGFQHGWEILDDQTEKRRPGFPGFNTISPG